jgi:hypothetical protein
MFHFRTQVKISLHLGRNGLLRDRRSLLFLAGLRLWRRRWLTWDNPPKNAVERLGRFIGAQFARHFLELGGLFRSGHLAFHRAESKPILGLLKSKYWVSEIGRSHYETWNKWNWSHHGCHVQLHVSETYCTICDYDRLRVTNLIKRAVDFYGVGVHIPHPKQFFPMHTDDAQGTGVDFSCLECLRSTRSPRIFFDAYGKGAIRIEHVYIQQDALFGSFDYDRWPSVNRDSNQSICGGNCKNAAPSYRNEKPSGASSVIFRRVGCARGLWRRIVCRYKQAAIDSLARKHWGSHTPDNGGTYDEGRSRHSPFLPWQFYKKDRTNCDDTEYEG